VVGLDKRILYLIGVGVGAYLIYKWYEERRVKPGGGEVRSEVTPGGGQVEVRRDSPDKTTIVYTNPQGSTSTITVPSGTEEAILDLLKRGEATQSYYEKMYKKPEVQPVSERGGVPPEWRLRSPAMM
jgi:hypothetical protein